MASLESWGFEESHLVTHTQTSMLNLYNKNIYVKLLQKIIHNILCSTNSKNLKDGVNAQQFLFMIWMQKAVETSISRNQNEYTNDPSNDSMHYILSTLKVKILMNERKSCNYKQ